MTEKFVGGGPAFPTNGPDHGVFGAGLTIRQYFAAAALQGLLASGAGSWHAYPDLAAMRAATMADALMVELEKQS